MLAFVQAISTSAPCFNLAFLTLKALFAFIFTQSTFPAEHDPDPQILADGICPRMKAHPHIGPAGDGLGAGQLNSRRNLVCRLRNPACLPDRVEGRHRKGRQQANDAHHTQQLHQAQAAPVAGAQPRQTFRRGDGVHFPAAQKMPRKLAGMRQARQPASGVIRGYGSLPGSHYSAIYPKIFSDAVTFAPNSSTIPPY